MKNLLNFLFMVERVDTIFEECANRLLNSSNCMRAIYSFLHPITVLKL
jgi:hypothetical protein